MHDISTLKWTTVTLFKVQQHYLISHNIEVFNQLCADSMLCSSIGERKNPKDYIYTQIVASKSGFGRIISTVDVVRHQFLL